MGAVHVGSNSVCIFSGRAITSRDKENQVSHLIHRILALLVHHRPIVHIIVRSGLLGKDTVSVAVTVLLGT
jgi:hypothetical protein